MDEEQSGDTNPNKVRGGHVGYLRQLYDEAESLLQQTLQVSEVAKIRETIDSQFKKYVNAHHYCVEKEHSLALVEKHDQQVEMYQEIRNKLDNYLKEQGATKNVDGFTPKAKSSEISSLKTVSKKEVELKVKYELYKLKLKQLEESQRIERQQQEIKRQAEMQASQHELDQAKLESELWEQASSNEGNEDKKSVTSSLKLDLVNKDQVVESTDVKTKVSVSSSMTFTPQVNTNIQSITPEVLPTVSSIVTSSMNPSATTFVPSNSQPQTFSNINPAFTTSTYSAIHPGFSQPYVSYVPPYDNVSQSNMLTKVLLDSHLPKPEQMVFNGDARNYQSFITNFETHIGSKVNDPSVKLTYLMQYCTGDVKQLLKNCVLMPPNQGYATAVTLLKEHFGQNHVIARSYIDGLIHGPQVKANDVDGLTKLSRDLLDCQIVLSQLKFTSDMDSSETIWCIAKRLPNHLHAKWVDQAADILQKGREPCYNDICRFIEAKARIGNTVYGRKYAELLKAKFPSNKLHIKQKGAKISTLTTQVNVDQSSESSENPSKLQYNVRSGSSSTQVKESSVSNTSKDKTGCVMCNSLNHAIDKCFRFIKLSLSEKLEIVKSAKLCFRCLKIGHFSKDCKMNCTKCHRRHNVLLHDDKRSDNMKTKDTVDNANRTSEPAPTSQNAVNINTTYTQSKSKVCLGIVPVKIEGNGACVETYALLDSGSNTTLLKRELYDSLDLDGAYKSFTVQTLSGSSSVKQQLQTCLTISSLSDNNSIKVQALTVDRLPVSIDCIATSADINQWDHLKGICLPEIQECQVGLLIGTNSPEMFWSLEERRGNHGEPMARRTLLGWIIIGPISQSSNQGVQQVNLIKVDELQKQLNRQWEVDFQDLSSNTKQEISDMSKDDKAALKIMQDTVEFVNGKYTLSIPWKIDPNTLPNNRKAAETRLKFLKKRFESDEKLQVQYTKTVTTYINDGHACIVNSAEITKETPQWYLPHHPVFKHSNPDKCRVVFDCAARFQGISLNEAIYQGPNLLNNLSGVLIRFRAEKVAIVADIEAMFHQCYVSNKDKIFLRFLWWQNGDTSKPPDVYAMQVHLFGATSSPSVANFCIHKTCEDHGSEYSKEAIQTVQRSFYMDDLLKSVKTIEEAINIVAELKELLGKGGFNLTKWMSSHREVITIIPEKDRAKSLKNLNITEVALPQEPTLGLQWNVEEDSFTYDINIKEKPLTRRGILSMTASLYDPLGFVCPVTLIPKLIQQNLCRNQLEWDDEIPTQEAKEFVRWQQSLSALSSVSIKRCFKSQLHTEPLVGELHIFSDASEFAYGAVAYVKLYKKALYNSL